MHLYSIYSITIELETPFKLTVIYLILTNTEPISLNLELMGLNRSWNVIGGKFFPKRKIISGQHF